jgi:hypothetical protein
MVVGVYICSHPWLDLIAGQIGAVGLLTLGYSGHLAERLYDSDYVTCFEGDWTFMKTFECETVADARRIENGVLHVYRPHCIDDSEVFRTTVDALTHMVQTVASRLGIQVVQRHLPTYERSIANRHSTSESEDGSIILTIDDHRALRTIPVEQSPGC